MKKFLFYAITMLVMTPFTAIAMDGQKKPPFFLKRISNNMKEDRIFLTMQSDREGSIFFAHAVDPEDFIQYNQHCVKLAVFTRLGLANIEGLPSFLFNNVPLHTKMMTFISCNRQEKTVHTSLSEEAYASTLPIDIEIDKEGIVKVFTEQKQ